MVTTYDAKSEQISKKLFLIAQKKRHGALNATQKYPQLFAKYGLKEKDKKNLFMVFSIFLNFFNI